MNAFTISKLAFDAGVSVHIARNYAQRGLLKAERRTQSGYNLYGARALARLRLVRAGIAAGLNLENMGQLCHALDEDARGLDECVARLRTEVGARRDALTRLDQQLAAIVAPPRAPAVARTRRAAVGRRSSIARRRSVAHPSATPR